MEVREAVRIAKSHLQDTFPDDAIPNLGLEEIVYDEDEKVWKITLGFSREWQNQAANASFLGDMAEDTRALSRDYRIVTVRDADRKPISIKVRELPL